MKKKIKRIALALALVQLLLLFTACGPEEKPTTEGTTAGTPTTEAPKSEGGCGGFVALGIVACLIPAAIVVCKKRD